MSRRTRWSTMFVFAMMAIALSLVHLGCNPSLERDPNRDSGRDGERGGAILMDLNTPVNGNVNFNEGDMTDWKLFQVPAAGTINLTLGCDNPGAWCGVNLRNEVGVVLSPMETRGEPRVSDTLQVPRGNYFLEIYASTSYTDYTIEVQYEPN